MYVTIWSMSSVIIPNVHRIKYIAMSTSYQGLTCEISCAWVGFWGRRLSCRRRFWLHFWREFTPMVAIFSVVFKPQRQIEPWLLLKIYLHIRFHKRFVLKDVGFEEKWGLRFGLNDLNTLPSRFQIWIWYLIWDLPITSNFTPHIPASQIVLTAGPDPDSMAVGYRAEMSHGSLSDWLNEDEEAATMFYNEFGDTDVGGHATSRRTKTSMWRRSTGVSLLW